MTSAREELEALCLEGLILTEHGWKYRPSLAADLLEEAGWVKLPDSFIEWGVIYYDGPVHGPYACRETAQKAIDMSGDPYAYLVSRVVSGLFSWKQVEDE